MGSPYQSQSASGYNGSPPPDDGSVSASNKVTWAKIKTQLGDAVKGLADAINTALRTALNVTPTTQASAYTTTAADHLRPIEATGTTTISLGDAATMVAQSMGYEVPVLNSGTATVTVAVVTATDKIAGRTNGTVTLAPGQGMRYAVNSTNNGYDIIAASGFSPIVLTGAAGTNTATANAPASLTALYAGLIVVWTPANTNTGALTLNITPSGGAALTAKNVFSDGAACVGQEGKASVPVMLEYDGTQFNILGRRFFKQPTQQQFLSGSGTYTTPAGVTRIVVRMVGGGGGGSGSGTTPGNGGAGGSTTFSTATAGGGGQGQQGAKSAGGTATTGTLNIPGSGGTGGDAQTNCQGSPGGCSLFGGAGAGGAAFAGNTPGGAAATNSGSGGGGGASLGTSGAGGGGGSGGYVELVITAPAATYSYGVGGAGTAGTAGTSGDVGGAGAAGLIIVDEYYT